MFADITSIEEKRNIQKRKALHNTWDTITIPANYFYEEQKATKTTIGRFLFNKYVLEGSGVVAATKVVTDVLNGKGLDKVDELIGQLYLDDVITRQHFNAYVDRRDNLGFWLNGMITHTISLRMAKPLKEIEKKKQELLKKYAKEIEAKDITAMAQMEKELIAFAKELLKDDPGMDLYDSGDLNFDNNYKNNSILKGPVKNNITGEYDFIENSYMDGIEIKDIPAHANTILAAQYPTSIATKDSGYMGKKLLALLQMMEIDEPGSDCKTKSLIPITVTDKNKKDLVYTYFEIAGQTQMLTRDNVDSYVGKTLMMRSPMSCITPKICSKCAGELFYKLGVKHAGLFATQLSHSALNLSLKSKHSMNVDIYHLNVDKIVEDI
jgi:DNA-directed RNA polymerase beta' subunit